MGYHKIWMNIDKNNQKIYLIHRCVYIYHITTRRSNHMKLMDKTKQAALAAAVKTGLSYLEKDPK